jgi:hypothetical protein
MFATHKTSHQSGTEATAKAKAAANNGAAPLGNQVWESRALGGAGIQPKLTVSSPDDPYEQQADRVADRVMRMETLLAGSARTEDSRDLGWKNRLTLSSDVCECLTACAPLPDLINQYV